MSDLQKHALTQAGFVILIAAITAITKIDWSFLGNYAPFVGMAASAALTVLTEQTVGTKN